MLMVHIWNVDGFVVTAHSVIIVAAVMADSAIVIIFVVVVLFVDVMVDDCVSTAHLPSSSQKRRKHF